ncbi:MAG TPA: hemolysin III family protein [Candidatus Polarisedimenticolaceae bacterium]|nr:hemolysin III family protein [Candidatus Polarisedimenticolaceae bacterium]
MSVDRDSAGCGVYEGERLNSISHLCGAGLALVALIVLVVIAARQGDPWKIVSFAVYGASLVSLYLFSTLYHGVRGRAKRLFRRLDHNAIYLLIAGTYTPFVLVTLRGGWGWSLFGVIWGLALVGIAGETLSRGAGKGLRVAVYLAMGWLIVIALRPLLERLPDGAIALLAAGGVLYSVGVVFYALDKRIAHGHAIWHLFVIAGSAAHFFAVLLYVALLPAEAG